MTVAAVYPELTDMMLVAEGNGLCLRDPDLGLPRRPFPDLGYDPHGKE